MVDTNRLQLMRKLRSTFGQAAKRRASHLIVSVHLPSQLHPRDCNHRVGYDGVLPLPPAITTEYRSDPQMTSAAMPDYYPLVVQKIREAETESPRRTTDCSLSPLAGRGSG